MQFMLKTVAVGICSVLLSGCVNSEGKVKYACSRGSYDGPNFYENIITAAAATASGATNPILTGEQLNMAALAAYIIDSPNGVGQGANSGVSVNPYVVASLQSGNICGRCIYEFYDNIVRRLTEASNWAAGVCGLQTSAGIFPKDISPSSFHDYESCLKMIQWNIYAFNVCASNGADVRTGLTSTLCSSDDFFELDSKYLVYPTMMKYVAANSVPLPEAFINSYSQLSCRSCFDEYMATLAPLSSSLQSVCANIHSVGVGSCIDDTPNAVYSALNQLSLCTGGASWTLGLWTATPMRPTVDEFFLVNNVLGLFKAMVQCAVTIDPTDNSPPTAWEACLSSDLEKGGSPVYTSLDSDVHCFQLFGHSIFGHSECSDAFAPACTTFLNTNVTYMGSPLLAFYHCSGFQLSTAPVTCEISANTDPKYSSYIPYLLMAMEATTSLEAGHFALDLLDWVDSFGFGFGGLPGCHTCYSALAAELKAKMTWAERQLCKNPYANICSESYVVRAALHRFKLCAGYALTASAPAYTCSADEWAIIREKEIVGKMIDSVKSSGSLFQGLIVLDVMLQKLVTETNVFRCQFCFRELLSALYAMSDAAWAKCEADVNSGACYAENVEVFATFEACSGAPFAQ